MAKKLEGDSTSPIYRELSSPAPTVRADPKTVLDVRREGSQLDEGVFRLRRFVEGAEYADLLNRRLIRSVGRNVFDGRIEAAVDSRYSGSPNWECMYSR